MGEAVRVGGVGFGSMSFRNQAPDRPDHRSQHRRLELFISRSGGQGHRDVLCPAGVAGLPVVHREFCLRRAAGRLDRRGVSHD